MSKIELFRLTVTVIDKYNEELEKGYPESYLIPDKSLQALDRKIDELLEKLNTLDLWRSLKILRFPHEWGKYNEMV